MSVIVKDKEKDKAKETQDKIQAANNFIEEQKEITTYRKLFKASERKLMAPYDVKELSGNLKEMLMAKDLRHPRIQEMTTSGKAEFLVPQVIIGPAIEGAEPVFKISSLFDKIQYSGGSVTQFPALGEIRAFMVAEGHEYPEQDFDMTQYRNLTIKVEKYGLMLRITEEALENTQWDYMGYWLRAAGRAMARLKEEQCIVAMLRHGHVLFDAMSADPHYQPTGVDISNNLNNTLSVMDFVDILAALMYNEKTVTDVIMHPMAAITFFKNELIGAYGRKMIHYTDVWAGKPLADAYGSKMPSPEEVISRNLPIPVNVVITPYAPFDRVNKRFDIVAIDRNNIGVVIQKDEMSTEDFDEPKRDVHCVKIKERYGIGIADQGRGIVVCKNLAAAPTYFPPIRVENIGN